MTIGGLLSSNPADNPDFYDANTVYVPYCSSDAWAGSGTGQIGGSKWLFGGNNIVKLLVEALTTKYGLTAANTVIYSGCSAGGQGVVNTLDLFTSTLRQTTGNPSQSVFGVADAGWMMNALSIRNQSDSVSNQFVAGLQLWKANPVKRCANAYLGTEYLCLFSPIAAPYISTPIMFQAEQYDSFQTGWDCCSPPYNPTQKVFIDRLRLAFQTSMATVTAPGRVFSAACHQHCLVEGNLFTKIQVAGTTMAQAVSGLVHGGPWANYIDSCSGFDCSTGCPSE